MAQTPPSKDLEFTMTILYMPEEPLSMRFKIRRQDMVCTWVRYLDTNDFDRRICYKREKDPVDFHIFARCRK